MKRSGGWWAWLQYVVFRLVAMALLCLPIETNLRTARLLARLWWRLPFARTRRHRERACAHIRLAYGDTLSEEHVRRIALASMEQMTMLAVEFVHLPRLIKPATWRRHVEPVGLAPALTLLLQGRGAILLTGHYGNWELTGFVLSMFGLEMVAVMRPLDNPHLNRYLVETRRRRGLDLLDKKGAAASAEKLLHRGAILGFIADQNAGHKGVFVDFFGTAASTYKSIGLLAMSAEAPVIVGCARRSGPGFRYDIECTRVIMPGEWRDKDDPLRWITQEYTSAIEDFVRQAPEQYLWIHRRWKSRPKEEKRGAASAAADDGLPQPRSASSPSHVRAN